MVCTCNGLTQQHDLGLKYGMVSSSLPLGITQLPVVRQERAAGGPAGRTVGVRGRAPRACGAALGSDCSRARREDNANGGACARARTAVNRGLGARRSLRLLRCRWRRLAGGACCAAEPAGGRSCSAAGAAVFSPPLNTVVECVEPGLSGNLYVSQDEVVRVSGECYRCSGSDALGCGGRAGSRGDARRLRACLGPRSGAATWSLLCARVER